MHKILRSRITFWLTALSLVVGLCVSSAVQYTALHAEFVTRQELQIILLKREIEFIKVLDAASKQTD